jgi:hypothetical protein
MKMGLLNSLFGGKKKSISPEERLFRAVAGDKESVSFFKSNSVTKDHNKKGLIESLGFDVEKQINSLGIDTTAQGLKSIVTLHVTSEDMAKTIAYSLVCEASILTESNMSSEVSIPDDIDKFMLNCTNNLTQFDEGYMEAIDENVDLIGFNKEIKISLNKFKNIRAQISDAKQRQLLSYAIIREIINFWEI